MRKARNLEELLIIRQENTAYLESINSNLGTALGLKNADGDPCVIVFVPRKIHKKWLPNGALIRDRLETSTGLWCPLDVVEGKKRDSFTEPHFVDVNSGVPGYFGVAPTYTAAEIQGDLPLSTPGKNVLLEMLKGWSEQILPGSQIFHPNGWFGTLGCFATDSSGKVGLLTNKHVAGEVNDLLMFPEENGVPLAKVISTIEYLADELRFPGIVDLPENVYRIDCAFATLDPSRGMDDIDPRIPTLNTQDDIEMRIMGDPLPLDLQTMGPIGQNVVAVGRTRSIQRGSIAGFAYSWDDSKYEFVDRRGYTDYLIVGEDGEQFSDKGDSGKLILTESGLNPVALLWGGWKEKLRNGRMQEDWTYAIDINIILKQLGITILKEKPMPPSPTVSVRTRSRGNDRTRLR